MSGKAKRLKWAREALELRPVEVYAPLQIHRQTFYARERNLIGADLLSVSTLVDFYNMHWQKKFNQDYPKYMNREVRRITLAFVVYGVDKDSAESDKILQLLKENYKDKEKIFTDRIMTLKAELMKK